jgi:bla regulator protein blaR1
MRGHSGTKDSTAMSKICRGGFLWQLLLKETLRHYKQVWLKVYMMMFSVLMLCISGMLSAITAAAWTQLPQRSTIRPAFEVASIKPNKSVDVGGARHNLGERGGRVTITKFSLRMLIGLAYDLPTLSDAFNRISGTPNWADSEYFDIEARAEDKADPSQKRLMLQSLLSERFKLAIHHEPRQLPVYALTVTKPGSLGPQLHPHIDETACEPRTPESSAAGTPTRSPADAAMSALQQYPCGRIVGGLLPGKPNQAWSGGRRVSIDTIAASIGGMEPFDRPIINRTRLNGAFDFTVVWHTQLQTLSTTPPTEPTGTSLLEALQEQLGLKLVRQTGPVEVLIVDRAERPTAN